MRKAPNTLKYICISIFFFNCNFKNGTDFLQIKKKYSGQVINYLYELAFFDCEKPKTLGELKKWKNDIYISLTGDTISGDRNKIKNAINQINSLKLPIKIYFANNQHKANLSIVFGSKKLIAKNDTLGACQVTAYKGVIEKVKIDISNNVQNFSTFEIRRQSTILHELVHSLGVTGHSLSYSMAVLRTNLTTRLSNIDCKILEMLYEPALKYGYEGKQFEKDFSDVLYYVDSKIKLLNYVKSKQINRSILNTIKKFGLYQQRDITKQDCIVKFNSPATVFVLGDSSSTFLPYIKDAISLINSTCSNIDMEYKEITPQNDHDGIFMVFQYVSNLKHSSEITISSQISWSFEIPRIIRTKALIKYSSKKYIGLDIANALFESLCTPSQTNNFEFKHSTLYLKNRPKEILKLYYDYSMPSGFTKGELEEVISQLH